MIKKIISILIVLVYISLSFLGPVTADGGIFGKGATIFTIDENTQYSVIHHRAGKQKMIVTVNFDWEESNKTVWIFPLPSDPEDVDIDIADGAPVFSGIDVIKEAKDSLRETSNIFLLSYMLSAAIPFPLSLLYTSIGGMIGSTGIDVYKHLEKYGLTAEVISAVEGLGIYEYLTENGLNISEGLISQLDVYVEKDFSFVVTWISSSNTSIRNPGIIIEFPTKNIFYPLILTSIYGTNIIPIELMIVGHVSPIIYERIEPHCTITYHHGEASKHYYNASPELSNFIKEIKDNWDGAFTRIKINAPSNLFIEDLWIKNKSPEKVRYAVTVYEIFSKNKGYGILIFLFIIFSVFIALIFGIVIFGYKKDDIPIYFILGWINLIGILGLILFMVFIRRNRNYSLKNATLFIISFIMAFILLIWILLTILNLPLS